MSNKFIVAGAGTGKTTHLVNEALKIDSENVLITTYTEANANEIKEKLIKKIGFIPSNVTIQTWFSFLLEHCVRPYQVIDERIKGMVLVSGRSASRIAESNVKKHYFDSNFNIYSDKIAKFALKCNVDDCVVNRLSKIFKYVFIDEVQDITGDDLDFIDKLIDSNINTILVGDPRQGTFTTNNSNRNRGLRQNMSRMLNHFRSKSNLTIDENALSKSYRCSESICDLSNKVFPEYRALEPNAEYDEEHQGVYLVKSNDVEDYLKKYKPTQLRWNKSNQNVDNNYEVLNFGESKGLTKERVLIYPTNPIIEWLKDNNKNLPMQTRSKLYVAITRARFSTSFVCDDDINGFITWQNN